MAIDGKLIAADIEPIDSHEHEHMLCDKLSTFMSFFLPGSRPNCVVFVAEHMSDVPLAWQFNKNRTSM